MRNDAMESRRARIARIQGYHSGNNTGNYEGYAFSGFPKLVYLNSDRAIALRQNDDGEFERVDNQPMAGWGLEVECECNGIRKHSVLAEVMEKIIWPNFKFGNVQFKMQSDASLRGDTSVEVITQVMTRERIRNDYAAWQMMFDQYFPEFGITCDAATTQCGMHVNISNALFGKTKEQQAENVMKLYYIINRHYRLMCRMLYRPESRTYWCGQMTFDHLRSEGNGSDWATKWRYENAKHIKVSDLNEAPSSHNNCINLSHFPAGRVEVRLVGGQRDYYCFRNTMETMFHLVDVVRKLNWSDLDNVEKIFTGCNNYVVKRLQDALGANLITAEQYRRLEERCVHKDFELRRPRR